jgi:hypothetical protein
MRARCRNSIYLYLCVLLSKRLRLEPQGSMAPPVQLFDERHIPLVSVTLRRVVGLVAQQSVD